MGLRSTLHGQRSALTCTITPCNPNVVDLKDEAIFMMPLVRRAAIFKRERLGRDGDARGMLHAAY